MAPALPGILIPAVILRLLPDSGQGRELVVLDARGGEQLELGVVQDGDRELSFSVLASDEPDHDLFAGVVHTGLAKRVVLFMTIRDQSPITPMCQNPKILLARPSATTGFVHAA